MGSTVDDTVSRRQIRQHCSPLFTLTFASKSTRHEPYKGLPATFTSRSVNLKGRLMDRLKLCLYSKKVHDDVHRKILSYLWAVLDYFFLPAMCYIFSSRTSPNIPVFSGMADTSVTRRVLRAFVFLYQHPVRNRNQVDLKFVMYACVGVECTPTWIKHAAQTPRAPGYITNPIPASSHSNSSSSGNNSGKEKLVRQRMAARKWVFEHMLSQNRHYWTGIEKQQQAEQPQDPYFKSLPSCQWLRWMCAWPV